MKGLTLWQPHATLVGRGKTVETRSWRTQYRGSLVIHSARNFPDPAKQLCLTEDRIKNALALFNYHVTIDRQGWSHNLPLGFAVATCRLVDIVTTERFMAGGKWGNRLTLDELAFGDYSDNRYAWILDDIRVFEYPIRMNGARALWDVPDNMLPLLV